MNTFYTFNNTKNVSSNNVGTRPILEAFILFAKNIICFVKP